MKAASKLSFKEEKELAEIPLSIEQLETEQAGINMQLADSEIYKTQADLVKTLQARLVEIDSLLEALLARWEVLDAKQANA
jgi:ATP-binding cassette subfamily F protein uup